MRALIISPWFGPRPPWWRKYKQTLEGQPFDWYFPTSVRDFRRRVKETIGVDAPIVRGGSKIHDLRPAFGEIYAEEIRGYQWWGHTDLDCVYGRLERFYDRELLAELDIFSDSIEYVGGPWTLFRNKREVRSAFRSVDGWRELVADPAASGWIEEEYSRMVEASSLRHEYRFRHAFGDPPFLHKEGRVLTHFGVEIPFFHFRLWKRWPLLGSEK